MGRKNDEETTDSAPPFGRCFPGIQEVPGEPGSSGLAGIHGFYLELHSDFPLMRGRGAIGSASALQAEG